MDQSSLALSLEPLDRTSLARGAILVSSLGHDGVGFSLGTQLLEFALFGH